MIIKTKRNHVAALEPLPGDSIVMTRIGTAQVFQPITEYDAAVRDSVRLADHMEAHLDVVPMDIEDFVRLKSGMSLEQFIRTLPEAVLEELWHGCINGCVEAVRYSDDPVVRAQAAHVLQRVGHISPRSVQ